MRCECLTPENQVGNPSRRWSLVSRCSIKEPKRTKPKKNPEIVEYSLNRGRKILLVSDGSLRLIMLINTKEKIFFHH